MCSPGHDGSAYAGVFLFTLQCRKPVTAHDSRSRLACLRKTGLAGFVTTLEEHNTQTPHCISLDKPDDL